MVSAGRAQANFSPACIFQTSRKQLPRMSHPPKIHMSLSMSVAECARMPLALSFPEIGVADQYIAVAGAAVTLA